jgi:hypothetical protein
VKILIPRLSLIPYRGGYAFVCDLTNGFQMTLGGGPTIAEARANALRFAEAMAIAIRQFKETT